MKYFYLNEGFARLANRPANYFDSQRSHFHTRLSELAKLTQPSQNRRHPPESTIHHSPFTIHHSPITNHQSPITNHQSPITNHQSPITNHKLTTSVCFIKIKGNIIQAGTRATTAITYTKPAGVGEGVGVGVKVVIGLAVGAVAGWTAGSPPPLEPLKLPPPQTLIKHAKRERAICRTSCAPAPIEKGFYHTCCNLPAINTVQSSR